MLALVIALVCLLPGLPVTLAQTSDLRGSVVINIEGAPSLGEDTADITLVEFSDYQCPFCGEYFSQSMRQIVNDYVKTGKIKYVFRDFPVASIHPLAQKAAEGAHCAGEQGKYWEMHDRFFSNQSSLGPNLLPLHAQMLNLDVPRFQQCLDSGRYRAKVRESVAEGEKAGVRGTPSFFLGQTDPSEPKLRGRIFIEGRQSFAVFKEAIDKLLSRPKEEPEQAAMSTQRFP